MIGKNLVKVKSLLIAEPFILDPNFKRSVILICEHNDEGTMGLILNKPTGSVLTDAINIDVLGDNDFPLFLGGPVENDTLLFIHKCFDRLNSGIELGDGIYLGGDFETLKLLIKKGMIKDEEIKFFLGYSGWSSKQFNDELKENTWFVDNNFNLDIIFEHTKDNMWKEAIINLGPKYAHVVNFPSNPSLN